MIFRVICGRSEGDGHNAKSSELSKNGANSELRPDDGQLDVWDDGSVDRKRDR